MRAEIKVYKGVVSGELLIDPTGRIWRMKIRCGDRWNRGSRLVACEPRRAEHPTPSGYLQIRRMENGQRVNASAHRLVYHHFFGPIPDGMVVNHLDGVKSNNHPSNLEIVTPSENVKHAYRTGLKDEHGESNPTAFLTDDQVVSIRFTYATGQVTLPELARQYATSPQTISAIVRGDRRVMQGGPTADYTDRRRRARVGRNEKGQFVALTS